MPQFANLVQSDSKHFKTRLAQNLLNSTYATTISSKDGPQRWRNAQSSERQKYYCAEFGKNEVLQYSLTRELCDFQL